MMILIIEITLLAIFGFFIVYLAMLSFLALFVRLRNTENPDRLRRFAIVVPAHNEEPCIERTIRNLQSVRYAPELHDIIVIADNCTDRTSEIARALGATVYERTNALERSKGYALRWCFDILLSREPQYDAFVVIDADSIISQDFLSIMNHYLANGSKAIQCSDMAEPKPGAWSSEVTRLGFTLYNYARPLGRRPIGCSAGLRGNGMCFSADTLRTLPWNTYSLNEDLEYGLILLLNGIKVDFAPEAKVIASMPSDARNAESQRARWEKGRFPIIRKFAWPLLAGSFSRFSFPLLDAFIDLIMPPFVNMFGAACLLLLINIILWQFNITDAGIYSFLWASLVILGMLHVLAGLSAARADRLLYKAFFYIPRYAFWKIILYTRLIRRGSTQEWIRTEREHATDPRPVNHDIRR